MSHYNNLRFFLALILHIQGALITTAVPPEPPVRCSDSGGCTLYNSYGAWGDRKDCQASNVTYPRTEQDLLEAVAYANQNGLKVKVVTKFSHTIPKLACPSSLPSYRSMLISTEKYNSNIEIDVAGLTVTADAGVGLRDLIDVVEGKGLSLVASPYWEGVSIGGVISTGCHGSSWWGKGGAVHDHVVGLSLIVPASKSQGYATVIKIDGRYGQDHIFNAAKVSLGLLGVISKVKLSLENGFKRSITFNFTDEGNIENTFIDHAKRYEFADITWYPSRHTAVYRYDSRAPLETSGDGLNDFIGFQSTSILISQATRATEKALENSQNVKGKCVMAATVLGAKKLIGNGLKNGLFFIGYPVVGRQGKMQTSGSCLHSRSTSIADACAWDPRYNGLSFFETTAIFTPRKFGDFIRDVKKLRDTINSDKFCGVDIYNGLLIRFVKASSAYLGQTDDSVVVDFNYYRADDASTPRLNQDVWEEVEQMAFFKYGAKPHWAKNRKMAFIDVGRKYPNFNKFMGVKKELDPENMFSSEWSDDILLGKGSVKSDGCALEGECVCSEDRHCSPNKGYFCKPGVVYGDARVCRYSSSSVA